MAKSCVIRVTQAKLNKTTLFHLMQKNVTAAHSAVKLFYPNTATDQYKSPPARQWLLGISSPGAIFWLQLRSASAVRPSPCWLRADTRPHTAMRTDYRHRPSPFVRLGPTPATVALLLVTAAGPAPAVIVGFISPASHATASRCILFTLVAA